jgi:hypothetical protein
VPAPRQSDSHYVQGERHTRINTYDTVNFDWPNIDGEFNEFAMSLLEDTDRLIFRAGRRKRRWPLLARLHRTTVYGSENVLLCYAPANITVE